MTNQENESTYTIGELAREFDITPRSIRFYEEQSLLSPKRTGHGMNLLLPLQMLALEE